MRVYIYAGWAGFATSVAALALLGCAALKASIREALDSTEHIANRVCLSHDSWAVCLEKCRAANGD